MRKKKKPNQGIGVNELSDSLVYIRPEQDGCKAEEPTKIIFSFPPGPTMLEFKLICMRMAQALGYPQSSIDEHFGTEDGFEENCELTDECKFALDEAWKEINKK